MQKSHFLPSNLGDWLAEDGLGQCESYWRNLPQHPVRAQIKIKSDLTIAGLPWFSSVFEKLDPGFAKNAQWLNEFEGRDFKTGEVITLPESLSWGVAVSGERLALNLLHRASAVATATKKLVKLASVKNVAVLDTRKTTPGLRELEKYAVTVGGGQNHRFTQVDSFMIKDNHKELMGLKGAVEFFRSLHQPYKTLIVEIHSLEELALARELQVTRFMLDNFTPKMITEACALKRPGEFFEVSGGINEATISQFLIPGVDAVSSGAITQFPAAVDISFKFKPEGK